ncbi:MAG: GNAT family N-acetyltransferase [Lewinellaceae bacterium]|nr:GNAT family N-acetyltransferase [Lewinellaceae bacterium]
MSERKTRYAEFCRSHYVPLHFQPWWFDAVCLRGAWDVCLATEASGDISGVLPYYISGYPGLKTVQQAPLTSYGGPWLPPPVRPEPNPYKRSKVEKKIFETLIGQLPHSAFFQINFRPDVTNWLPFYWAGFRQTTRYTYLFADLHDPDKVWAGFKNTLRTDIRKAMKAVEVRTEPSDFCSVFRLHERSFHRKNLHPPYTFPIFQNLHEAASARSQSACFMAYDQKSGAPHAGLYLVFDTHAAFVLLTGQDPAFKSASAIWLLFWEAIKFCAEKGLTLDFEGSMNKNIERGFRAFGAQLTPYHQVFKAGNRFVELVYGMYKSIRTWRTQLTSSR